MPSETTPTKSVSFLSSVFVKAMLLILVCIVVVVATIETRNQRQAIDTTRDGVVQRGQEVSRLLAMQLGGAVRFENAEVISEMITDVMQAAGPDAVGAAVFNASGDVLFTEVMANFDTGVAAALAQEAITSGDVATSADGKTVAVPLFFGDANASVGAVVTAWTGVYQFAALAKRQQGSLLWGLGVMVVALLGAGAWLFTRITRPLKGLEGAMRNVADGDYDTAVPHCQRNDEIGHMALVLNSLRLDLGQARDSARETAFKSAAFVSSSAPMMMADAQFRVTFVNPACEALIGEAFPAMSDLWPGMDVQGIHGADLCKIEGFADAAEKLAHTTANSVDRPRTAEVNLNLRGQILRVRINPAFDPDGQMFGCVIEWSDLTQVKRNAALIDALDNSLISIEFTADGRVANANANLLALINGKLADTSVCSLAGMFRGNIDGDEDGQIFVEKLLNREITQGRFNVTSAVAKKTFVMDGSFALLADENGETDGVIFLASDVTEHHRKLHEADAARAKDAEEQTKVVSALGAALTNLSGGDLETRMTERVPASYEKLRSDFNATVDALREAISSVMHNAESIRNETGEITSAADDLSRRTEKQAATLEETAAALDELTVSVRSAAEGADDASKMSNEAQKSAAQGGDIAREAVAAMDGIKTSSQEISKITSVIDDIAFQTNLLALNAGVEAARAGEAGRGFAVVATEVRALAQRSSDAAREINALISSSGEQVQHGVELVDKTGAALAEIVTSVSEISNRVSAIASSAREQSTGLAEINVAVTELDHVTQQNAAMFEETTAASHALTAEADALALAVARFRIGGSAPVAAPAAPRPAAVAPPASKLRGSNLAAVQGNTALEIEVENVASDDDGWEEF